MTIISSFQRQPQRAKLLFWLELLLTTSKRLQTESVTAYETHASVFRRRHLRRRICLFNNFKEDWLLWKIQYFFNLIKNTRLWFKIPLKFTFKKFLEFKRFKQLSKSYKKKPSNLLVPLISEIFDEKPKTEKKSLSYYF